jgi:hypothetical protein
MARQQKPVNVQRRLSAILRELWDGSRHKACGMVERLKRDLKKQAGT